MTTDQLLLASANAAALWAALAETRGYDLVRRPGLLAIHGPERFGVRIMVLAPEVSDDDLADLRRLATGRLVIEDPFGTVRADGLAVRTLPVMIREPAPADPPARPVTRVTTKDDLAAAEQIVVDGFELEVFQPYRRGEMFPQTLLDRDDIEVFRLGRAGAALAVLTPGAVGVYWVTTMPAHRSQGIGRSLMLAMLARHPELPMTLAASRAGRPLYESLGFTVVTESMWWATPEVKR